MMDRKNMYYFETDFSKIKSTSPFEIPLNSLLSLFSMPPITESWTPESIDQYSEENNFGFNVFKLSGNKAELSIHLPGKCLFMLKTLLTIFVNGLC